MRRMSMCTEKAAHADMTTDTNIITIMSTARPAPAGMITVTSTIINTSITTANTANPAPADMITVTNTIMNTNTNIITTMDTANPAHADMTTVTSIIMSITTTLITSTLLQLQQPPKHHASST